MGKKTSNQTTKAAAPEQRAAKPAIKTKAAEPAVITPPPKAAAPKIATPKIAVPAPVAPKAPAIAKPVPTPVAPVAPTYTQDDVALRAYFIAEKRQAAGLPGESHLDWLEAERQLLAESAAAKKPKAKGKKV